MSSTFRNPIIPGYYPDPSICRVGEDYYLACSSFELWPGIPIFHSRDLVHWEQIANAVGPENGLHVEHSSGAGGLMAPTIRYHNGRFYLINANFADRGNYIVTAEDPRGPWSEIHWLDDVPGIDASLFFDDDGRAYILGTGDVWDNGGHMERGIWLAEYDAERFRLLSEPVCIFNSALRVGAHPEAPHLYHVGDYYYLLIAEGGTEHYHAVMAARSRELFGFYEGCPANPVMTHRHMGFRSPILNVGHADLVDLPDGSWYAVMLASRLIDGACKNLGRETFLCPVRWERDWPLFSPDTGRLEWSYPAPALPEAPVPPVPARCDFDGPALPLHYVFWGTPYRPFWRLRDSRLELDCVARRLDEELEPVGFDHRPSRDHSVAFVGLRQTQPDAAVTCAMEFAPRGGETAGLALAQAMNHQLHLELACEDGRQVVRAVLSTAAFNHQPYLPGFTCRTTREVLAAAPYDGGRVVLRLTLRGEDFTAAYGPSEDALTTLCRVDGRRINPEQVGCMCGTVLGVFASGNGRDADNTARFDWLEYVPSAEEACPA